MIKITDTDRKIIDDLTIELRELLSKFSDSSEVELIYPSSNRNVFTLNYQEYHPMNNTSYATNTADIISELKSWIKFYSKKLNEGEKS